MSGSRQSDFNSNELIMKAPTSCILVIWFSFMAIGAPAQILDIRRAASVKNELGKNFAADASRMETDGKGESQPVGPNDNPTKKALNRRVEFIKL